MTLPPSVPSSIRDLYSPTGKAGRLGSKTELATLAAAVLTTTLLQLNTDEGPRPVAGALTPDHGDLRPGALSKYQFPLTEELAKPLGCTVYRERLDHLTVYGDPRVADVVRWLAGRALTDLHDFADREYLRVFYRLKGQGRVEEARGERSRIVEEALTHLRRSLTDAYSAAVAANPGLGPWLTAHSTEAHRLTPAGRRSRARAEADVPPPPTEKQRRLAALEGRLNQPTGLAEKRRPDDVLETVYGKVLTLTHGLEPNGPPTGSAFYTNTKDFSVSAAVMAAGLRLGVPPTRYRFFQGYLYLSSPAADRGRTIEAYGVSVNDKGEVSIVPG